jgi:D-glycero-D-manno-heptose 1,7-bisphosphate phosphatase
MKRPAVFFDRDNTLIVSDGYLGDPSKVVLMEGAADAIAKARQYGFKIVTFSNQSGVARGLFSEEDVQAVNLRMDQLLLFANPSAAVHLHLYCPFHPEGTIEQYRQDSELRKPKPGMILQAAEKLNLDLGRSWVVGDAPRDIEAGKAAGCRTILFRPPVEKQSPDAAGEVKAEFEVGTLKEAVEIIAREAFRKPPASGRSEAAAKVAAPAAAAPRATMPVEPEELSEEDCEDLPEVATPAPVQTPPRKVEPVVKHSPNRVMREAGAAAPDNGRVEGLLEEILRELKRGDSGAGGDFSVSKLMAGIVQIMALGTLFLSYLNRGGPAMGTYLQIAIFMEALTIALLIMGKQR